MQRFLVFQLEEEWLVACGDQTRVSFPTRKEAERSAFEAADALASNGHAVSVLIMPEGPDVDAEPFALLTGRTPRMQPN